MTARLATHPDVATRTADVMERLRAAGVDVEFAGAGVEGSAPLEALRGGSIDLALVGIQALRGSGADDLTTVAVLPREEVRDVLITLTDRRAVLSDLPSGARVGVAGARRAAFLRAHRQDVEVIPLSEGVDSLDRTGGEMDAAVISALDARRGGLVAATVEALDIRAWLPEPGQGALVLVARHPIAEATALDHLPTRTALRAELALLDALEADSDAALGCVAQPSGRWIRLWAGAASGDGRRLVRSDRTGPLDEPEALGASVAQEMIARGYGLVEALSG